MGSDTAGHQESPQGLRGGMETGGYRLLTSMQEVDLLFGLTTGGLSSAFVPYCTGSMCLTAQEFPR